MFFASLPPIPPPTPSFEIQLPETRKDWVEYKKRECADQTDKNWFGRCFSATFLYYEWLQKHHPREYLLESAKLGSQVIEFKKRKF